MEGEHPQQRPWVHGGDVLLGGHSAAAAEDGDDLEVVALGGVALPAALPQQRLQLHEQPLGVLAAALLARQEHQQDEGPHHEPRLEK